MTQSDQDLSTRDSISTHPGTYVEAGSALADLSGVMSAGGSAENPLDAIVIGAGQSGLTVGYFLQQRGLKFAIIDGAERIGDQWRKRWDSLRLFSTAKMSSLVGLPFPAAPDHFPTKDEMGDYLEQYARHFALPVHLNERVQRVSRQDGLFLVQTNRGTFYARQVVVAMANYQKPKRPEWASELSSAIHQMHSADYKRPGQLVQGDALMVGCGNSGAEIALDVSKGRNVWICGRNVGYVPFRIGTWLGRNVILRLVMRVVFHRVMSLATPVGRKIARKMHGHGGPLVRTRPEDLEAAGVQRGPRVVGVQDGKPLLEDGRVLDVRNVVFCTGFHPGFSWIDLPIFDESGEPRQQRGITRDVPGLYFVGLHFLYALSSGMIHGMRRDAEYVVDALALRAPALAREATASAPMIAAA